MNDVYKESLELHRKHNGKLGSQCKVPLKTREDLALAYTPGVAEISRVISKDKSEAKNLTLKGNTVAVISDGSAILGLGNLGPEAAIPVMEGKCVLFKEFANVDAFPLCVNTQDVEEIIQTVKNVAPVFGGINLEDISAPRCFIIEERLKKELSIPVMHDDQHGTATVVLAGLINSLKVAGLNKEAVKVVVNGVGAAGTAIIKMLLFYGFKNILSVDSKGIIYDGREELNDEKKELSLITNKEKIQGSLSDALLKADIFIGVSKGNILDENMIRSMNAKPIIFALANPIPEIMPDLAKQAGAFIVATGRSDFPNQINNVLAFPGIFRGALDNHVTQITDNMLVRAAENLANSVQDLTQDNILPSPLDKKIVSCIANAIYE